MHSQSLLCQEYLQAWCKPRTPQAMSTNKNANTQDKKELQSFLIITNYLSKFSLSTAQVCEQLWKLMSVKIE